MIEEQKREVIKKEIQNKKFFKEITTELEEVLLKKIEAEEKLKIIILEKDRIMEQNMEMKNEELEKKEKENILKIQNIQNILNSIKGDEDEIKKILESHNKLVLENNNLKKI